jgi:hypothetical protein
MAYCDDWFPLSLSFRGIAHRMDIALSYLPQSGVSFHPDKTRLLLFNPSACPQSDRHKIYSSPRNSPPLTVKHTKTANVVGHIFDSKRTDLPHVNAASSGVTKAVQLLVSAGLGSSGSTPIVVQVFAYAAVATASLLFGAATYVKGRAEVTKALNNAWTNGLKSLVGIPESAIYAARDLAWELQTLPPADEILMDAFSLLYRVLQRNGDSLIKRHLTARCHRKGSFKSEWRRWLATTSAYKQLAPLLDTPISKVTWQNRVRKVVDTEAAKDQDAMRYVFTPANEGGTTPQQDTAFMLMRLALRPSKPSAHPPLYRVCGLPAHIERAILYLRSNCWPSGQTFRGFCPLCETATPSTNLFHVVACGSKMAESRLCHSRYLARDIISMVLHPKGSLPTLRQVTQILLGTMPDGQDHGKPLVRLLQSNFSEKLESLYVTIVADMETIDAQYRLSCI